MNRSLFELLGRLATEGRNEKTAAIDLESPRGIMDMIHAEDRTAFAAVEGVLDDLSALAAAVAELWSRGGRLIYVGAGTSGRLGVLDAAELPPTFSVDPSRAVGVIAGGPPSLILSREGAEDHPEHAVAAIVDLDVGPEDGVVALSASYRTPFAQAALREARDRSALTGYLVCNRPQEPLPFVDHLVVAETGPEAVAGSTRMKAALAQKMMLTLLSTTVMVLVGKVYRNLMVDVRPTSAKLTERAVGLVMLLAEVDYESAHDLLTASDWDVKTAVLASLRGLDPAAAAVRLDAVGGRLRAALEDPS